jgi:hypothetical protein
MVFMPILQRFRTGKMLFALVFISFLVMTLLPGVAFGLPLVAITRPTQGAAVSGVIWIDVAFRSDSNRPITRLEIYIDDALAREVDLASPLLEGRQSFNWDFSYLSSSVHKIGARAIDASGQANTASITVRVQNATVGGPDRIPPVVRIFYPAQGSHLRGQVEVKAEATDNVGVELVYFYIDGRLHKMIMKAPPYVDLWDTTREADGSHVLEAVAVDAAENEARSAQVTVIVENHNMTLMPSSASGTGNMGLSVGGSQPTLPTLPGPVASLPAVPDVVSSLPTYQPPVVTAPNVTAPGPTTVASPDTLLTLPGQPTVTTPTPGQVLLPLPTGTAPTPATGGRATLTPTNTTPSAPRIATVTPRANPLGPVPVAPEMLGLPLDSGSPVTLSTGRSASVLNTTAPATTSGVMDTALAGPSTSLSSVPQASSASLDTAPKASAPLTQCDPAAVVTTTATPVAPTTSLPAGGPASVATGTPAVGLQPLHVATTPGATAFGELTAATVTTPRPSISRQSGLEPIRTMVAELPPAMRTMPTAPAAAVMPSVTADGPQSTSRSSRPTLARLAPAEVGTGTLYQEVTPLGPPVTASSPQPVELTPILAVSPTPKSLPAAGGLTKTTQPTMIATTLPATASPSDLPAATTTPSHLTAPVAVSAPSLSTAPRSLDLGPSAVSLTERPTAGLSRLTAPPPASTGTPVEGPIPATTPVPVVRMATTPAPTVDHPLAAVATTPARTPIVVAPTPAAIAEYRGTPVPADRMLARLPDSQKPLLTPPTGKTTQPPALKTAVPIAVAKVRDIKIVFDGEVLSLRAAPETRKGISLAPLREIFQKTDGVLYWFPVERGVHAVNKNVDMHLTIGDPLVSVNGQTQRLEIAPFVKQGRTMVPLQFIADVLDINISFDARTGQILISSNQF